MDKVHKAISSQYQVRSLETSTKKGIYTAKKSRRQTLRKMLNKERNYTNKGGKPKRKLTNTTQRMNKSGRKCVSPT